MDCPYCGKTIKDGGFICASCSAAEKTEPVVSKENDSENKVESPSDTSVKTTEIESKSPIPIVTEKQAPKPITKIAEVLPPTIETKEAKALPTTIETKNSQIDSEKNQVKDEISISEPTQPSQPAKPSDKWKNYPINADIAPATSVFLVTLLLLFVSSFLFIIMLVVLANGPRYAAVITGLVILTLLVLPIFIKLDEMRLAKWKRFASWVYNNGLREKATYEMKVNPNSAGDYLTVRILKVYGDSLEESELRMLSKAPRKLAVAFGEVIPHFIASSDTNIISEADIIYDPDTIKHGLILERNGQRIWLSTTKFNAPV